MNHKTKTKLNKPKKPAAKIKRVKLEVISHVREVMEAKNVTGYKMAVDLNITNQSIYSFLMKPDYSPSLEMAFVLSEYLGTPITKLFEIKK